MKFKEWKYWFSKTPWVLKWFLILILIRPFVDSFFWLKEISIFISPLYIIGVLVPILSFVSIVSNWKVKRMSTSTDIFFFGFTIIAIANIVMMLLMFFTVRWFGEFLKTVTPLFLFLYLRQIIRNKRDFQGIMQTFLYSCSFPLAMLLYELIFGPIYGGDMLTEQRGGGVRYSGAYADMMGYAVYIFGGLLIGGYLYIAGRKTRKNIIISSKLMFGIALVGFVGAYAIKHVATWGVILALVGLFVLFTLTSRRSIVFGLIIIMVGLFAAPLVYEKSIAPLISKEIAVVEGEKSVDRSFNGRMSRWKIYFAEWEKMPLYANVFGASLSGEEIALPMSSGLMHSDYVRNLFMTGIVGLIFYLLFLFSIMYRQKILAKPEKFLLLGTVGGIMLYSVTTNPQLYPSLCYLTLPVFAYVCLPNKVLTSGD